MAATPPPSVFPPPPSKLPPLQPHSTSPRLPGAFFPTRVSPPDSVGCPASTSSTTSNSKATTGRASPSSSQCEFQFPDGIVDRERLQEDARYRIAWSKTFIGFTTEDGKALNGALPVISPTIEHLVDDIYQHLFKWDYTTQPFLKRNVGYDGELAGSLDYLRLDHPQIQFRKRFLRAYVYRIFDSNWDDMESWEYLDRVGLIHTGLAGVQGREKNGPIKVDLMACTLLLGWVQDVVLTVVLTLPDNVLSGGEKIKILRAFNKVIWIQQDLFQRHYIRDDEEAEFNLAAQSFTSKAFR